MIWCGMTVKMMWNVRSLSVKMKAMTLNMKNDW